MITEIISALSLGLVIYLLIRKVRENTTLKQELKSVQFTLKSAYVKFGKMFEHFAPFTNNFPGNKDNFVFIGMPIDGICFDEDCIKFIEVKTGESKLSSKQQKIKGLIEEGKVEFNEVRY